MAQNAYDRVVYLGATMNRRMKRAVRWVEAESGVPVQISQGAYRGSSAAAASGSTHDRGASLDIRTSILTEKQRKRLVKTLKRGGWAAWYRGPGSGFSPHIHAVLIGDKEASTSAKWQMGQFDQGRSGLTSAGPDPTFRPSPPVKFSFKKRRPVPR